MMRPTDAAPPPRRLPRPTWGLTDGLLAVPGVVIAVLGWTHRWMAEDGFIYLRIAHNLSTGHGPVFNRGERVEAYTGVLWTGILAVADLLLPVRFEWIAVVLGLVTTTAGVVMMAVGARVLVRSERTGGVTVPLGAAVFAALWPAWCYATSGLETGLIFAWLGACLWVLAAWATGREPMSRSGAALLGLGWLVRPELVVYSALFMGVVLIGDRRRAARRDRGRVVLAFVALPVAYQLFRMAYFGMLVSNTAIAKEGSDSNLQRGWSYARDFAGPYWLWVPLVALLAGGYLPLLVDRAADRRGVRLDLRSAPARNLVLLAFPLGALLNAGYVIAVGGDYHHARMFLPPLFAFAAPVGSVALSRRHLVAAFALVWAGVSVLSLRPDQQKGGNWMANGFLAPRDFGKVTADDYGWGRHGPRLRWYQGPHRRLLYGEVGPGFYAPLGVRPASGLPLPAAAFYGVGVAAYAPGGDLHVIDLMGLADGFTSHLEKRAAPPGSLERFPGHEKPLPPAWQAALLTRPGTTVTDKTFLVYGAPLVPTARGRAFAVQVAWARAALRCPRLVSLRNASRGALGPGRMASNLLGSFRRTELRIPPEPRLAYRRFCGRGTPAEVRAARRAGR